MLIKNQRITVDFDSKEPVKITDFKYKEGEIDKNGIVVDCLGVALKPDVGVLAYWLYSTQDEYIFVPVAGERKDETTLLVRPPQSVLIQGEVGLEIILTSDEDGVMKSPSIFIGVEKALVVDEEASEEDENLSVILQLINQVGDLHQAAIELNADMAAADAVYKANEQARQTSFSKIQSDASTVISSANTAASNANTKATLADQKAALANTAATNANTAKTNADTAASNANAKATLANDKATLANTAANTANTAATAANTAKTNADTAASNANAKAILANDKAALANTAATNANNAASVANGITAEVVDSRTDYSGVVHDSLKTRLDNDYETLASLIPTDIAFDGYESVTTNDTLSGDVKSTTLTGQTLVNLSGQPTLSKATNVTTSSPFALNYFLPKEQLFKNGITYTVLYNEEITCKSTTNGTVTFTLYFKNDVGGTVGAPLSATTGINMASKKQILTTFVAPSSHLVRQDHTADKFNVGDTLTISSNVIILEGDHTDKPLEFFEGLKSAEVSEVTSHGVNFVDESKVEQPFVHDGDCIVEQDGGSTFYDVYKFSAEFTGELAFWNRSGVFKGNYAIFYKDGTRRELSTHNKEYVKFSVENAIKISRYTYGTKGHRVNILATKQTGSEPSTYIPYASSKTTLSEPIILRSLPNGVADTYDVDTGLLTRRCGEVVLNGTESWALANGGTDTHIQVSLNIANKVISATDISEPLICDKFNFSKIWSLPQEAIQNMATTNKILISIAKSKLTTPDVAGFKAWFAQNPTTVVYQLAESTTEYIENNGQLRSYDYQTTVSADSIVPVKLSANIPVNYASTLNTLSTVARELKLENLSLIEQAELLEQQLITANETNDYQDSLIDVSLLATDELYTLIEPLLPEAVTFETKGGNAMVDAYVAMVIKGLKTIDQVPSRYREEVKRVLAELEK